MKASLIVLLFSVISLPSLMAQDYSGLEKIKFKPKEVSRTYENKALECANYLINTPDDNDDIQRSYATLFLWNWMKATPDYGFDFENAIMKLIDRKSTLGGVYLATLVKYCLENKEKAKNPANLNLGSAEIFLNYCKNPGNTVKITKKIKTAAWPCSISAAVRSISPCSNSGTVCSK